MRGHIDGVVEYHNSAVAQQAFLSGEGFVIERRIEQRNGKIRTQRTAHLDRPQRSPRCSPPAEIVDRFAKRQAERLLHKTSVLDISRELDSKSAARFAHPEVAIVFRSSVHDDGHRSERDDIVHHCRLAEQPFNGRQRRLKTDLATFAFQTFKQRSLFAANVSSGAEAGFDIETFAAASDVGAQIPILSRKLNRALQCPERMRIFGADVNITLRGFDSDPRNGHAFDQDEGVALHDHAIGVCSAVPFVCIADDIFLGCIGLQNRTPLYAGGKTGAAASAQSRAGDFFDDGLGLQG